MKICFFHELDTGFMAATLKPAFERLGHECIIMQGWNTHLEADTDHIDYQLNTFKKGETQPLIQEFKDTDFFILRAGDALLQDAGIIPYITKRNAIYRLHGHDLTALGRPYALDTWRIKWHNNQPQVVTYQDPLFYPHLKTAPIYIERPIDLSLIPRKRKAKEPFALNSPAGIDIKGGKQLADIWNSETVKLKILSQLTRKEVLALKAQAHFFIDNLNPAYHHGPYGMNTVEAWLLKIPAFSFYIPLSKAICPLLPRMVTHTTMDTVQKQIEDHIPNKKDLNLAYQYAKHVHASDTIAHQYLDLYNYLLHY